MELTLALLNIMNAVYVVGHLYNDISPDNIMFHFPKDESRVYIGVCDWGMTMIVVMRRNLRIHLVNIK
jgi:hypothetical protein